MTPGHIDSGSTAAPGSLKRARHLYEAGRTAEASALARQISPDSGSYAPARTLLGLIAHAAGNLEDARDFYQSAVDAAPANSVCRCNLAQVLIDLGRFDEADREYAQALAHDPDQITALNGRLTVLLRQNNIAEASDAVDRLLSRSDLNLHTIALAAETALRHRDPDRVITLAARASSVAAGDPSAARQLWFVTARAREMQHNYERAFAAFARANAITAQPYRRETAELQRDRMIAHFSRDRLPGLARSTCESMLPVFVVGMPRSGSTLIEQIIHSHPAGYGAGELSAMRTLIISMMQRFDLQPPWLTAITGLRSEQLTELADEYLAALTLHAPTPPPTRIVDKALFNFVRLGAIAMLFPQARIIHTVRDPLATCWSCWTQNLAPRLHPWSCDLSDAGHRYVVYRQLIDHFRRVLPLQWLDVEYESLVADPEPNIRRIVSFLDLDWDPACLRFHESTRDVATISGDQVVQPLFKTSLERWRPYDTHLSPLREALSAMR